MKYFNVMETFTTSDGIEYNINSLGVVTQKEIQQFNYNKDYISTYNSKKYKKESRELNLMRLSLMVGCLGYTPAQILDFGYGNGDFLRTANKHIRYTHGFDIAPTRTPNGSKKVNNIDDVYDCACFWDSLEHVEDISFLKFLRTKSIIISLPQRKELTDFNSFSEFKMWFEGWKHRKPNEHIHHFSRQSLESFFNVMGYRLEMMCNLEDEIRKPTTKDPNIITAFFTKI
jgi:hypothetical protein